MALEESPAFQFYPKDWLTSERTRVMGAEARGYYMDLLSYAWLKKGLPTALRDLAVLLSVPRSKMQRLWVVLGPSWVEHQGRLINTRQEEEREKQNLYRQRQKDAAHKRWESRGSPDAGATDIPLESLPSSSSSSSSVSSTRRRRKRPIFSGQRLVVFDWMFEDLLQILGPYADGFALDEWLLQLDQTAVRTNLVIPKRDGGTWLQAELLREVRARGLPMAGAEREPSEREPWAWSCPTCGEIHEGTAQQTGQCLKGQVG